MRPPRDATDQELLDWAKSQQLKAQAKDVKARAKRWAINEVLRKHKAEYQQAFNKAMKGHIGPN